MSITTFLTGFALLFILPLVVPKLFDLFGLPELPGEYDETKDILVCTYRTYEVAWVVVMFSELALIAICMIVTCFLEGDFEAVFAGVFICILSVGMVWIFAAIMKNSVMIFLPDGILHRTVFGNIYCYPDESITGYYIVTYRYRGIYIKTGNKTPTLSSFTTNYEKAKEFVKKYPAV